MWKLIILAAIVVPTVARAFQNEPTGFRGIAWDTPFSAVRGEMLPYDDPEHLPDLFQKVGDTMSLGGAPLDKIVYEFHHGVFTGVYIFAKKRPDAIIAAFQAQFGEGIKTNQFMDKYVWQGPIGFIYLSCSSVGDDCIANIESRRAFEQKKTEKADEATRAKKDF